MSGRLAVAAFTVAVALAAGAIAVYATNGRDDSGFGFALALAVGLSFAASGLVALWRRPANRTGLLLAAVGYLWFVGVLTGATNRWVFAIGFTFSGIAFGAFAHLVLAYPTGRLKRRLDTWLVATTYGIVIVPSLLTLLVDRTPASGCNDCPQSPIVAWPSQRASDALMALTTVVALGLVGALLTLLARRFARATPALRRVLWPVLLTSAASLLLIGLALVVDQLASDKAAEPVSWLFVGALTTVPAAFLLGLLRSRLARSGVGDLLLDLRHGMPLRDALARALHDPSLEIGYWLPDSRRYVDQDGKALSQVAHRRAVRTVERAGRPIACLVHDPTLADEPELVDSVAVAAELWLENERLQAELRAQLALLETIVDTAPSLLCSLDPEGRIVNLNLACARAAGYDDEEEMRGRHFWDLFIDPADRESVIERFHAAAPDHAAGEYENGFTNRRGEQLVIAWAHAPLYDEDGKLVRIVSGGLDITERKRNELQIEGQRDFLSNVGDTIPSIMVLTDPEGQIVFDGVNREFRDAFGWSTEEASGRSVLDFVHPDDDYTVRMAVAAAANGVARTDLEARWLRRDGEALLVAWTATPITHPSEGELVLISGLDITDRKHQEDEIRASRTRIVEAGDAERRRLERNLHDGAQQRLVSLSLSLRLAQARLESDPRSAAELLAGSREELALALDELRELARGIHPAVLTERGLPAALEGLAARSPLPVEVELPDERLPAGIEAAAYYVSAEALTNVAKYAQATSARVRVTVEDESVVVEVADDGVGGAEAANGSGLRGLADRVAALDGALTVDSPPGAGTRVRAAIPVREPALSK